MKSFLLEQLARVILPLSLMLGLALFLKGHDEPGGGFVGGLSIAVAGLLGVASFGEAKVRRFLVVKPERIAVAGVLLSIASLLLPVLLGRPILTQLHGELSLLGFAELKWSTTMVFDAAVVMIVGGGLTAAGSWLWEWRSSDAAGSAGEEES
jgi:multicomponent Na+:H+ antiporter subunit B